MAKEPWQTHNEDQSLAAMRNVGLFTAHFIIGLQEGGIEDPDLIIAMAYNFIRALREQPSQSTDKDK